MVTGNNILLQEIIGIKGRIRKTMANELHNGNITFEIRLAKAEEIKKILTPREELEKLKQENAAVVSLIEKLGLDLV